MGIIYSITNNTGWVHYIGSTKRSLEIRWGEHIEAARLYALNPLLQTAPIDKRLSKNQCGFRINVLARAPDSALKHHEQEFIDRYRFGYDLDNVQHNPTKGLYFHDYESTIKASLNPYEEHTLKEIKWWLSCDDLKQLQPYIDFYLVKKLPNGKYCYTPHTVHPDLKEQYDSLCELAWYVAAYG